jgi:hypothetical protein
LDGLAYEDRSSSDAEMSLPDLDDDMRYLYSSSLSSAYFLELLDRGRMSSSSSSSSSSS